jgi:peptide deformylase
VIFRYYGHPDLRARALPITQITPDVIALAHEMIKIMITKQGIGLAAPQVGKRLRLFVRRDEKANPDGRRYFEPPKIILNPSLSHPSQESTEEEEGCLSLPGLHIKVRRPQKIHLRYQTLQGEWIEEDLEGLLARCTMHENDHLNGVLIIDRASPQEKERIAPLLRTLARQHRGSLS